VSGEGRLAEEVLLKLGAIIMEVPYERKHPRGENWKAAVEGTTRRDGFGLLPLPASLVPSSSKPCKMDRAFRRAQFVHLLAILIG